MNPQQDIYNMTVNSPHKESLIIKELILNIKINQSGSSNSDRI